MIDRPILHIEIHNIFIKRKIYTLIGYTCNYITLNFHILFKFICKFPFLKIYILHIDTKLNIFPFFLILIPRSLNNIIKKNSLIVEQFLLFFISFILLNAHLRIVSKFYSVLKFQLN